MIPRWRANASAVKALVFPRLYVQALRRSPAEIVRITPAVVEAYELSYQNLVWWKAREVNSTHTTRILFWGMEGGCAPRRGELEVWRESTTFLKYHSWRVKYVLWYILLISDSYYWKWLHFIPSKNSKLRKQYITKKLFFVLQIG